MKIIFFGTPDFVVPIAEGLYKAFRTTREKGVVAVVTQPPKPTGRKQLLEYSPIDKWAFDRNIQILHDFADLPEADLGVVAAYGRIIPNSVIKHFPHGILNVHPSLLPKYRGASPIQGAIAAGETQTGVTIIKMDELMDHGPIVSSFREDILPDDSNDTLRNKLFERTVDFLVALIPNYVNGKINLKEQNHDEATFTKILKKDDGYIENIFEDPTTTFNKFRAYDPWPGIWTKVKINNEVLRLKILKCHLENDKLVLDEVQLEGKNPVSWEEFQRGHSGFELSS